MQSLVLLRHGQSTWNKENLFTGWTDVGLTDFGISEAHEVAQKLIEGNYTFDLAFTSFLKRSIDTLNIVLEDMGIADLPVIKSWRLNERHYGALQGLNKAETSAKYGEQQVHIWRRSYNTQPPPLDISDERHPSNDPLYADIDPADLPSTECLADVVERFMPYWQGDIVPEIKAGKRVLICAHGNSLRALVKYLDNVPDDKILEMNIPTGVPLIYELDDDLKPLKHYYLGDPQEVARRMKLVAEQAKPKSSEI